MSIVYLPSLLVSQYTLRLRVLSSSLSLLGQVFEERMRNNASEAVEKLLDLQAKTAQVLRDGNYVEVAAEDIHIGDLIRVRPGKRSRLMGRL